jgi:hypothetical protein
MANLSNINNKFLVTTDGNVGIGETNIENDNKLHIKYSDANVTPLSSSPLVVERNDVCLIQTLTSNASDAGILFGDGDDNDVGGLFYLHGSDAMTFRTNTSERMRIHSYGAVDIGDYVQLWDYAAGAVVANRAGSLRLESQAKTGWAPDDEHGKIIFYGQDTSGVGARNAASIRAINTQGNGSTTTTFDGALAFYTSAYNSFEEEAMRIDSSGKLLVGITSGDTFDMAKIKGTNSVANDFTLIGPTTSQVRINFGDTDASAQGEIGYNNSTDSMRIVTNGSERMRIDSSGTVTVTNSGSAVLKLQAGTNSSASLRLINDAHDWDINCQTNDKFAIYSHTDATERLVILPTSGNVGIGTTTPDEKLVVNGSIGLSYDGTNSYQGIKRTSVGNEYYCGTTSTGTNEIHTFTGSSSAKKLVILESGNVGIGTDSPAHAKLVLSSLVSNSSDYTWLLFDNKASGYGDWSVHKSGNNNLAFGYGTSNGASYTDALTLEYGGNVGIGETNPSFILDTNITSSRARFKANTGDANIELSSIAGRDWLISSLTDGSLRFYDEDAASERMRITSGGDVLFGTTGLPNGTSIYGSAFHKSTVDRMILRMATSITGAAGLIDFFNPNGQVGYIATNGSSTQYVTSSDYRLKENVVEMTDALDRVSQLKPSRFNFIADADKTVDGFLAHEVQEIVPEAITGEKDAVDEEGNPEYQGIDQSKLVPLLVGAIQELKAEIELLKTQINN